MVEVARKLFTVDEYHQLVGAGILNEDDRTELINGEIFWMPPMGHWHANRTEDVTDAFYHYARPSARIAVQLPIHLSDDSEPTPDVVLIPLWFDREIHGHPTPNDILLLVEVADTTIDFDMGLKAATYAREGIREYWVVNRQEHLVVVHRVPRDGTYAHIDRYGRESEIRPLALPEIAFPVADLLGRSAQGNPQPPRP